MLVALGNAQAQGMNILHERVALPEGRAVVGTVVQDGGGAQQAWTAVSCRPWCLAAFPLGGEAEGRQTLRWFFQAQPISVSQNHLLAQCGDFILLLDDGAVWRCSLVTAQRAPQRPSKRAKAAKGSPSTASFAIESDARSLATLLSGKLHAISDREPKYPACWQVSGSCARARKGTKNWTGAAVCKDDVRAG